MGSALSGPRLETKPALLGLFYSGKTTLLHYLSTGEVIPDLPVIGFNVLKTEGDNHGHKFPLISWHVGGRCEMRPFWRPYFEKCNCVIFIVDSCEKASMEEAKDELQKVLFTDMPGAPVLIFANKQDLPEAMGAEEIAEQLEVAGLRKPLLKVQPCVALTGEGVEEGMAWLHDALRSAASSKEDVKHPTVKSVA